MHWNAAKVIYVWTQIAISSFLFVLFVLQEIFFFLSVALHFEVSSEWLAHIFLFGHDLWTYLQYPFQFLCDCNRL